MPPELILDDEEYVSDEDSDFAPDAAPAPGAEALSDEDSDDEETTTAGKQPQAKKRKRGNEEEAEDLGFENSGDEAIIGKGLKKEKRRKGRKGKEELEDEEGEGGLVKTRSMRAQEKVEKKPLADTTAATIDVDAVWAAMLSGKTAPLPASDTKPATASDTNPSNRSLSPETKPSQQNTRPDIRSPSLLNDSPDDRIMIKRSYTFAGKIIHEEKLVRRDSAEAKQWLASNPPPCTTALALHHPPPSTSPFTKPKRPLKKARRSVFEPLPTDIPQRTDLLFGKRKEGETRLVGGGEKVKKFNTVEKSAMDWAGFVDKEGIQDELDAAGKSKGAYKARQEFLARTEAKKEEDSRRARGLPV